MNARPIDTSTLGPIKVDHSRRPLDERLERRFCEELCAEDGSPPCWQVAPAAWRSRRLCHCEALARIAIEETAKP